MTTVQAELYGAAAADLARVCDILDVELASDDACVQALLGEVARQRGKMLRPALVLLSGRTLGRCTDDHYVLAAVVEMVHVASLVHDDVIDEADARRNMPSANRTMGNEGAVLLGDYIMATAFRLCNALRSHEANQIFSDACSAICLGELMQVAHRRNLELSEAEYLDIIAKKTARLLRTSAVFGAVFADADPRRIDRLAEYGHNLGMAFQIADDVLDLIGSEQEMGKTLGRDLAKGELTLPLIHFLSAAGGPARAEMVSALGNSYPDSLGRIRQLLLDSDSLAYCGQLARNYTHQAIACLTDLPACEARDCLSAVAEFVLSRRC